MAQNFDREGSQLKAPFGMKYDNLGRVILFARAHDTLVAGTPYRIKYDEYGPFTAAVGAANVADTYRVAIAKKAYLGDEIGEFVHGGQYSGMVTVSLSVAVGHQLTVAAGAVADGGADYNDLHTSGFAICYTGSTNLATQDVIMIPEPITATS